MYAVVFFDALRVKIRDERVVRNKAVYLALGVASDGTRDALGLWIEQTEGAKFWLRVVNDLKNRGVDDVLIAVVDGLKGFPEAIQVTFPRTTVQTCIVRLIRNSLAFANWKERKLVAAALRPIYKAPTAEAAAQHLAEFESGSWGVKFPTIAASWRRAWEHVIPFFAFAPEVRKVIYTTNAIESLHMQLRKIIKNRGQQQRQPGAGRAHAVDSVRQRGSSHKHGRGSSRGDRSKRRLRRLSQPDRAGGRRSAGAGSDRAEDRGAGQGHGQGRGKRRAAEIGRPVEDRQGRGGDFSSRAIGR